MIKQRDKAVNAESELRLLSLVTLLRKVRDGITDEELYRSAERKFDTLIEILGGSYPDNDFFETVEFSREDFRQGILLIFNRLISRQNPDPYMTLCVSNDASPGEIRRRRNMLLKIFHPDRNRENIVSDLKAKIINEAYEKIMDEYGNGTLRTKRPVRVMPFQFNYKKSVLRSRKAVYFVIMTSILALLGFIKILFL